MKQEKQENLTPREAGREAGGEDEAGEAGEFKTKRSKKSSRKRSRRRR